MSHLFVGRHLKLLEALTDPLIHLEIFLDTVVRARVFDGREVASREVENAVLKALLGKLIVIKDEVLELFNLVVNVRWIPGLSHCVAEVSREAAAPNVETTMIMGRVRRGSV